MGGFSIRAKHHDQLLLSFLAAMIVTSLWFIVTWRYGFDFADEGYYWYGAQRVLKGEIPIRDFMAYDLGRYYWAAAIMKTLGSDDIFSARFAAVFFHFFAVWVGVRIGLLAVESHGKASFLYALLVACILTIWIWPYYKSYDHACSIFVVSAFVLMFGSRKRSGWFVAGMIIGLVAIIGRNHGVYGVLGSFIILAIFLFDDKARSQSLGWMAAWAMGVLIGYLPMLAFLIFANDFAVPFVDSIKFLFDSGVTNIIMPVPWPWASNYANMGFVYSAIRMGLGFGFVALIAFPLFGVVALYVNNDDLRKGKYIVFFASVVGSVLYAHYAFSRPDLAHLALGIFPMLLGVISLPYLKSTRQHFYAATLLLFCAFVVIGSAQPYFLSQLLSYGWREAEITGHRLLLARDKIARVEAYRSILPQDGASRGSFLALPNYISIHAMYGEKMPVWEIYPLFKRGLIVQEAEVRRISKAMPNIIVLSDHALDHRDELKYSRLQPLAYEWINRNYEKTVYDKSGIYLEVYKKLNNGSVGM